MKTSKQYGLLIGSFLGAALAVAASRLYARRSRKRIPSSEGLDDPQIAAAYNQVTLMPQFRLLRWYVACRVAHIARGGTAVDLGCGPGLLTIKLAQQATDLHVIGVDLSDEMLIQGEAYARRAGLTDRVSFRKGDAQQMPFQDKSVDLVMSTLSLHHWREPVAVLDEIARVLRPGGAFMIFDLRRDLAAPFWLLLWFATHFVVPPAIRKMNEPLASRDAAYTPAEVAQMAQASQLTGWRVTTRPLWLVIEGANAGTHYES